MASIRRLMATSRSRLAAALRRSAAYEFLPARLRDDDLFLVEFPKSGVTWLTFLMANVHLLLNQDDRKITFFNINDFIPDIQVCRFSDNPPLSRPGFRCFKSHSPYLWQYRKVFYLVRDPRDVLASYWAFKTSLGQWNGSLEDFVSDRRWGIRAWTAHVSGWLDSIDPTASFTFVRYEDLLSDTAGELRRLYALLGVTVDDSVLALAVERSNVEHMRQAEADFSERHPALRNLAFVRRSKLGGPRALISPTLRRNIEHVAGSVMQRLGYSIPGAQ